MEYEKIKESFGSWAPLFKKYIESDEFDNIFRVLKSRKGKINTAPESSDLFRAFKTCDKDNLKVILCGIAPYHTFINKKPVADGLMMSCSKTGKLQPSLWQVYEEWERTYSGSIDPDMWNNADLEYLSKQGVLLYNVALTVQENKACSDNYLWEGFNKYFWEEVIGKYFKGICIVFLGQQAHKSAAYINPMQHYYWCLSHPASASYNNSKWDSKGVFKEIDTIIEQNNGKDAVIKWYRTKKEKEQRLINTPYISDTEDDLPF